MKVPEINGFLTPVGKKNGEVEDELDRSLEGMDHSDDTFDKGTQALLQTVRCRRDVVDLPSPWSRNKIVTLRFRPLKAQKYVEDYAASQKKKQTNKKNRE